MASITTLFASYSLESIIVIIFMILVAVKAGWEIINWFYEKLKKHFNILSEKDLDKQKMYETIDRIEQKVEQTNDKIDKLDERMSATEEAVKLTEERMQENTRSYLIDSYHKYKALGQIDDMSLQSLEMRYTYYKQAGGDSFIDLLMEEVRRFPRIAAEAPYI